MTASLFDRARLAVRLEEACKAARTLLGDRYDKNVEPWRVFVRDCCAAWDCNPLQVVPRIQREGNLPEQPLLLIAASVDVAQELARRTTEQQNASVGRSGEHPAEKPSGPSAATGSSDEPSGRAVASDPITPGAAVSQHGSAAPSPRFETSGGTA